MWILNTVKNHDYYPSTATNDDWSELINLHYTYVKNNQGSRECASCKKYFKVCNELNRFLDSL